MGSEMCIRDRPGSAPLATGLAESVTVESGVAPKVLLILSPTLFTSSQAVSEIRSRAALIRMSELTGARPHDGMIGFISLLLVELGKSRYFK